MNKRIALSRRQALRAACALPFLGRAFSQTNPQIGSEQLSDDVYMVSGDGGNIGVVTGENAVMMIDGGYANRAAELLQDIADHVDSDLVTIMFNTHYHGDHVGCNETLGEKSGTKIIAHENVKKRLSTKQTIEALGRTFEPLRPKGVPSETFARGGKLTFGTTLCEYVHFPDAHTDGDSYFFFPDANVLHTGDLFFNGFYPVIDYSAGGWLGGMADAARALLKVGDAETQIIPGHGPLAAKTDLQSAGDMLSTVRERLEPLAKQGRTLAEVSAASPLQDLDARWGTGPIKADVFLRWAYTSVLRRQHA